MSRSMKDTISRQAAIDVIRFEDKWLFDAKSHNEDTKIAFSVMTSKIANLPSAESKIIRCKDCKHYHEDVRGDEIGHEDIPLILAHQMCDFWGGGCKTKEDAFCSFAEIAEE